MLSEDHCRRMLIKALHCGTNPDTAESRRMSGASTPGSEQVPGGPGGPFPPGRVLTAFPGWLRARVRSS